MNNGSTVALAGNPNCGKTTLFNKLTGLNHKVGNYPGITVERRSGRAQIGERTIDVVDLPGTYSLIARSRDEAIAFEVLTGRTSDPPPDLTVIVVDASNLDRNLYFALSILELGRPALVALNMMDVAGSKGISIDADALSAALSVPVVPIVAKSGSGVDRLREQIDRALAAPPTPSPRAWKLREEDESAIDSVAKSVSHANGHSSEAEAIWILSSLGATKKAGSRDPSEDPLAGLTGTAVGVAERVLPSDEFPARVIEARYHVARQIAESAATRSGRASETVTDRLDTVLLHPVAGTLAFLGIMAALFQSIFAWAEPLMNLIEGAVGYLQAGLRSIAPPGALVDLTADGIIGGVGNVLVFIPQIAILFAFIAVLEDSGYLARAAFISDRLMAKVGLHGRAFVPLLSGFACAVPAVMATRTIESRRDRLVTIMVAPLVSCSARLPVYALIIAALFASERRVLGVLSVGGLLLLAMYLLSVVMTVLAAFVLKRTVLKSPTPPLVLELPPYRMPDLMNVVRRSYDRCKVFVRDAGTMILACSIVLWALLYFPRQPEASSAMQVESSFAGTIGKAIEPAIEPLGFDWKIGVGLLASFAAREVFVSTMGLVYGVGEADEETPSLREAIRADAHYTPLVGLGLMVFFVLACQCMSTLAVVRRETNSLRWPVFMFGYMTVLAYVGALIVHQTGRLLGFG
jgi:ferrous iron transport protein B